MDKFFKNMFISMFSRTWILWPDCSCKNTILTLPYIHELIKAGCKKELITTGAKYFYIQEVSK